MTISIRTSFLIHLVQEVCVLEIGRRFRSPIGALLSCCAASFASRLYVSVGSSSVRCGTGEPFSPPPPTPPIFHIAMPRVHVDASPRLPSDSGRLRVPVCGASRHAITPPFTRRAVEKEKQASAVPSLYSMCFAPSSLYFHWEGH